MLSAIAVVHVHVHIVTHRHTHTFTVIISIYLFFFFPLHEFNSINGLFVYFTTAAVGEAPPIPLRAGGKRTGSAGTVPPPRITNIPVPLPEEADGPPPATPTLSATAVPLSECGWYWQDISR